MKLKILSLLLVLLSVNIIGCVSTKRLTTRPDTSYIEKNAALIEELAKLAIAYTLDKKDLHFETKDITDAPTRRKFERFGLDVLVTYNTGASGSSLSIDSTVIFKSIQFSGVKEVIFDFAAIKRKFTEDFTKNNSPYLLVVTDRIYYRKREFPFM